MGVKSKHIDRCLAETETSAVDVYCGALFQCARRYVLQKRCVIRTNAKEKSMQTLLDISEIAAIFKCSKKTVYRLISEGELEALNVRGSLRVTLTSVDYYINNQIKGYQKKNGVYKHAYAGSI